MRSFTDVLADHRGGKLVGYLSEQLQQVVDAVRKTGKSGEMTIKLKIAPSKGDDEMFEVTPNCKLALPQPDLAKGMFFVSEEGDLLRSNPNNPPLFKAVETGDLGDKPNAAGIVPR